MNESYTISQIGPGDFQDTFSLLHQDYQNHQTALLFHGLTGMPTEMKGLAERLFESGFNVYVPLLAGHGESIQELKITSETAWIKQILHISEELYSKHGKICLTGLSFGGLLALYLASKKPAYVSSIAVMSTPYRFKSIFREMLFSFLSFCPDMFLNHLPIIGKTRREVGYLAVDHKAFSHHSLGAAARLMRIRKELDKKIDSIPARVLIMQDPNDHHLDSRCASRLKERLTSSSVELKLVEGAQHEMLLGHKQEIVINEIIRFFKGGSNAS